MIKEAYCSFEVSKLLKEKGFDWECIGYYVDDEPNDIKYSFLGETNSTWESRCCAAPTHQMAMRWLREIYGIDIVIEISDPSVNDRKYYCVIWDKNNDSYILDLFNSYEDAVEAALKYCLENLI